MQVHTPTWKQMSDFQRKINVFSSKTCTHVCHIWSLSWPRSKLRDIPVSVLHADTSRPINIRILTHNFKITKRKKPKNILNKFYWFVFAPRSLKKMTTVCLTGIRLFSDTFYPGGLTRHCIQSAWMKALFDPAEVSCQDVGLKVMKVVSFKPKAEVWNTPLLIISTTVTFVLKHSLALWPLQVIGFFFLLYINNTWRMPFMSCKMTNVWFSKLNRNLLFTDFIY